MSKKKDRVKVERYSGFVKCPFCGFLLAYNNPYTWCASCYCEYTLTDDYVIFDRNLKTPKFALAKAIAKAGGMSFGKIVRKDDESKG